MALAILYFAYISPATSCRHSLNFHNFSISTLQQLLFILRSVNIHADLDPLFGGPAADAASVVGRLSTQSQRKALLSHKNQARLRLCSWQFYAAPLGTRSTLNAVRHPGGFQERGALYRAER